MLRMQVLKRKKKKEKEKGKRKENKNNKNNKKNKKRKKKKKEEEGRVWRVEVRGWSAGLRVESQLPKGPAGRQCSRDIGV